MRSRTRGIPEMLSTHGHELVECAATVGAARRCSPPRVRVARAGRACARGGECDALDAVLESRTVEQLVEQGARQPARGAHDRARAGGPAGRGAEPRRGALRSARASRGGGSDRTRRWTRCSTAPRRSSCRAGSRSECSQTASPSGPWREFSPGPSSSAWSPPRWRAPATERLMVRVMESRLLDETVDRLLDSEELWLLVAGDRGQPRRDGRDRTPGPRLRGPGRRRSARPLAARDAWLERAARRALRRKPLGELPPGPPRSIPHEPRPPPPRASAPVAAAGPCGTGLRGARDARDRVRGRRRADQPRGADRGGLGGASAVGAGPLEHVSRRSRWRWAAWRTRCGRSATS